MILRHPATEKDMVQMNEALEHLRNTHWTKIKPPILKFMVYDEPLPAPMMDMLTFVQQQELTRTKPLPPYTPNTVEYHFTSTPKDGTITACVNIPFTFYIEIDIHIPNVDDETEKRFLAEFVSAHDAKTASMQHEQNSRQTITLHMNNDKAQYRLGDRFMRGEIGDTVGEEERDA